MKKCEVHPAKAGIFNAELEYTKDESCKTAKIKMLARTGEPINHPYWGNIVHDLNGMKLHKNRLSIDYNHNPDEIIGYLNKFDISTGDLVASGALTPFEEKDRASELIFKMGEGVPYEASINFADSMVLEDIDEGMAVNVNGRQMNGPLTVVREWGLRNIAVCPMGADKNTETTLFNGAKEINVKFINKEIKMDSNTVVETKAEEVKLAAVEVETVEKKAEEAEVKTEEVVLTEPATVEAEVAPVELLKQEVQPVVEEPKKSDEREVFKAMVTEFGNDLASKWFAEGLNIEQAKDQHYLAVVAENKALKSEIEKLKKLSVKDPVVSVEASATVVDANETSIKQFMSKGMTKGEATIAASLRIPKR
jgi:hypothetical protein